MKGRTVIGSDQRHTRKDIQIDKSGEREKRNMEKHQTRLTLAFFLRKKKIFFISPPFKLAPEAKINKHRSSQSLKDFIRSEDWVTGTMT